MKIRLAKIEDAQGLAKVHVDSWRTTYKGIVDPEFLCNLSYREREERWLQRIPTAPPVVAINSENQVVGFASGGKERTEQYGSYDGEVYAIYLLESYQGKGIGRQIIHTIVKQLVAEGYESMIIRVLKENKARFFYEAIGGNVIAEGELTIGSGTHKEIVYGWSSLDSFLQV